MRRYLIAFKKIALLLVFLQAALSADAVTYYSRQTGYWTAASSWSTVTYGNATNAGTYPQKGDIVYIGDSHTITMDMNAICASVTVGQGSSGKLTFSDYLPFTMTIAGTLTINAGGTVDYVGNLSRSHNLFISRHIINNGTLDLYRDFDDVVNIIFNSTVDTQISGSGTFDLNRVTMAKNSTAYMVDSQTSSFENAIRNLVLTTGIFQHGNAGTANLLSSSSSLIIGADATFQVPQGTVNIVPSGDYLYLEGTMRINGGTAVIGDANGLQGIRYRKAGTTTPGIIVSSGQLEVRGGINVASGYATSPFSFAMSGGNVLLNTGTTGSSESLLLINDVAGSSFTLSNGTIIFQNPNTSAGGVSDLNLNGTQGTVNCTAGTVEFGNLSTSANAVFSFEPYANIVQPNFRVTGSVGNPITLCTGPNSTSDFKLLSLNIDPNKTFDIRSISGSYGDSKAMTLTFDMDGMNAIYNQGSFIARNSNVILEGSEGQWMSGTSPIVFYDFTVNNPYGVVVNTDMQISNLLLMSNGIVYSSALYPVVMNITGQSTIGSSVSFVDGPVKKIVSSVSPQTITFPVGKGASHRPVILNVQHSSMALVEYTTEMWNSSAQALGLNLPIDLRWVSDVRYYTIVPSTTANLVSARVTLSYDTDDFVNDFMNLRVGRDDGAGNWINSGGVATANVTGSVASSPFTTFNTIFTLANPNTGANWLPVELVKFTGKAMSGYNLLEWTTASEVNSSYFQLERSADGINFESIARIAAAGSSSVLRNYAYQDTKSASPATYYRLKKVDLDGTFAYSDLVLIRSEKKSELVVYPNPTATGKFHVRLVNADSNPAITVNDLSGRNINVNFQQSGNELELTSSLPQGVYLVRMTQEDNSVTTSRLVVADATE